MATRVLDKGKVVELIRKYRPSVEFKAGGGNSILVFTCPFHPDTNPSFNYTIATDYGICYSCQNRANLAKLVKQFEQISDEKAKKIVAPLFERVNNSTNINKRKSLVDCSMEQIHQWAAALSTDTKLLTLVKKWGWTEELIQSYYLGSSEGRLVIPLLEKDVIIGVKFYSPGATSMKYQNMLGSASVCWPLDNLSHQEVFLVEGEKDCLTMLGQGLNAVTFTTGAGKFSPEYIRYFSGKDVVIIYDVDEAGRKGATAVAKAMSHAAKSIKVIDLPMEGKPKGDITDLYMMHTTDFADVIRHLTEHTDLYVAPEVVNRVAVAPEIIRTYLEDIVRNKLFYKRVNMKVRVVNNAQHETSIIPKDVLVTCNKDHKMAVCNMCTLGYKDEGFALNIRPDYAEIMSMVGNNNKVQREAIRSMLGIAEGCPKFKIEQKSHQALVPIVIIPAIEADKKYHDYSLVTAWALDVPAKENEDYDVEGVILANPETQHLELICHKMMKDEASIDQFELTEQTAKELEIFQCNPQP